MRKYVLNIVVALLAFGCGVACVVALDGSTTYLLSRVRDLILPPVMFVPSAICFSQTFASKRGLRRSTSYNLLMLSLSGLLFIVGTFAFFIMLLVESFF